MFHIIWPLELCIPRELPYVSDGCTLSGGAAESNSQGDGGKTPPPQSGTHTTTGGVLCYMTCRILAADGELITSYRR